MQFNCTRICQIHRLRIMATRKWVKLEEVLLFFYQRTGKK